MTTKAKEKAVRPAKAAAKKDELRLEYLPLSELEKWPKNPKRHSIPGLMESMKRWGFTLPIMLDEASGRMVAGHGREEALSSMKRAGDDPPQNVKVRKDGEWLVPVVRGNDFGSEEEAEKYLIADNRFVELGGWDPVMLLEMLKDFDGPALASVGFDEEEIARLEKASVPTEPPEKWVQFTADSVPTEHKCPSCGFRFSE